MVLIVLLAMRDVKIAFSPTGHGLMTIIISFLVVAKVNLSYDRYMQSRHAIGHALSSLRELNQTAITYSTQQQQRSIRKGDSKTTTANPWRVEVRLFDLSQTIFGCALFAHCCFFDRSFSVRTPGYQQNRGFNGLYHPDHKSSLPIGSVSP